MKRKLKRDRYWVVWNDIGCGITVFHLFCEEFVSPVGTVYAIISGDNQDGKSVADITGSHVVEWARRNGVRSKINDVIFETFKVDAIITHSGTKHGKPFMEASGYVKNEIGQWMLTRKVWAERKALKGLPNAS